MTTWWWRAPPLPQAPPRKVMQPPAPAYPNIVNPADNSPGGQNDPNLPTTTALSTVGKPGGSRLADNFI